MNCVEAVEAVLAEFPLPKESALIEAMRAEARVVDATQRSLERNRTELRDQLHRVLKQVDEPKQHLPWLGEANDLTNTLRERRQEIAARTEAIRTMLGCGAIGAGHMAWDVVDRFDALLAKATEESKP